MVHGILDNCMSLATYCCIDFWIFSQYLIVMSFYVISFHVISFCFALLHFTSPHFIILLITIDQNHKKGWNHRYRKAKNRLLKCCYMPATSAAQNRLLFYFFCCGCLQYYKANKASLKQSIILRCLWLEFKLPKLDIKQE